MLLDANAGHHQDDELVPAAEPHAGHAPLDAAAETQADLSAEIKAIEAQVDEVETKKAA